MLGAATGDTVLKLFTTLAFPYTLLVVVAWTTTCWLVVTMLTAPKPQEHLVRFYRPGHTLRRVREVRRLTLLCQIDSA